MKNSAANKNSVQTDSSFWAEFGRNRSDLTKPDPTDSADFRRSAGFRWFFNPVPARLVSFTYGQHFASLLSSWMQWLLNSEVDFSSKKSKVDYRVGFVSVLSFSKNTGLIFGGTEVEGTRVLVTRA
jgi:hypothetical protein